MTALERDLNALLGADAVMRGDGPAASRYLSDATESRGIRGTADAIALPADVTQLAALLAYCDAHDVPVTPRGGGTGYAGGAVPARGIVLATERLTGVPHVDPARWQMQVPVATRTADVRRRARQAGLYFPPDPGSAEQSLIGGNIATNAGGPHTFKYGVTGRWVTGLQVVLVSGEVVSLGSGLAKDVSGYDLKSLLIGSEGTLGVICAATLALIPAPEAALPLLARYPDTAAGTEAISRVLASGTVPAALEFLDSHAAPDGRFTVITEADGDLETARRDAAELRAALEPGALGVDAPETREAIAALWRWRDGVSLQVAARRGGKLSEDIAVPVTRLAEAVEETIAIGERHGLQACSWGHAGDGNLHSTFLIDRENTNEIEAAEAAAEELFALAIRLGGTISGEHGIGRVKRAAAARALAPEVRALNRQIKSALDPKGLLNPNIKLP